jgi:repressor LexA
MTRKQQQVFEFIQRYMAEHRLSPLIREIQAGCQIVSYKSALDRLNALERRGLIKRTPNKHRGIKVVRKAAEAVQTRSEAPQKAEEAVAVLMPGQQVVG